MTVARSDSALLRRELDRRGLDEDAGATAALRVTAWVSLIVIVLATVVSIAFAESVWVALPGFVWLTVGVLTLAAGASAALLWQESRGQNSRGLSTLAATYAYLTVVYPAFFLCFPGAIFSDAPWLGGSQSSVWLYFAVHLGTVVGIGISCFVRIRDRHQRWWDVPLGVLIGVLVSAWAIQLQQTLPVLIDEGVPNRPYDAFSVVVIVVGVGAGAVVVVSAIRTQSRLRWWLLVVLALVVADVLIHMFATARWQVAWYVPRIFGALTVALLMVVLFAEIAAQSRSLTSLRVRERLLKSEELRKAAETDPLTGCLNRRGLDARFSAPNAAAPNAAAPNAEPGVVEPGYTAVYFVDLDNFKGINDEYSHDVGDAALRVVAQALKQAARVTDLVVRYGGDEFVVIAQALRTSDDADSLAEIFVDAIKTSPAKSLPGNLRLTASLGYVVTESVDDLDSVISQAESLMRQAKKDGKDRSRRGQADSSRPVEVQR